MRSVQNKIRDWFVPLSCGNVTLRQARSGMQEISLDPLDLPLIVRLVENPEFDLPGFDIFHGATSLQTHDYIHILLGRGMLPKDEAFVVGFTMGSTDRVSTLEEKLYCILAKDFYPRPFKLTDADLRAFRDGVKLGFVSDCESLAGVDYERYLDTPLSEVRKALRIEEDLLMAYYAIEKRRFPLSPESQRLLDPSTALNCSPRDSATAKSPGASS